MSLSDSQGRGFRTLRPRRDKMSASEWNRITDLAQRLSRSEQHGGGIVDYDGINPLRQRITASRTLPKKIFKVLDVAYSGDGMYHCSEMTIDDDKMANTAGVDKLVDTHTYTAWETATVYNYDDYVINDGLVYRCMYTIHTSGDDDEEPGTGANWEDYWKAVYAACLNLQEAYPLASYSPALAAGDIIVAWRFWTDDVTARDYPVYAGIPLGGSTIRLAKATEAAGAVANITCNLLDVDGAEITTGLGAGIEVYANISPLAVTALNACIPRIVDNDEFPVINIQGKWWFATQFQGTTDCDCIAAQSTSYAVTNEGVDRTYDANATSTEELADVLGTLINDLILAGVIT